MIYNLIEYIVTELSTLNIVANGFSPDSPITAITVKQSGGDPAHWHPRKDFTFQILSRSNEPTVAKYNIDLVYNLLENRYGLELPSVTVDNIVYSTVQTYQISPIQIPGDIGSDDENLEMWSFNIMVTTK